MTGNDLQLLDEKLKRIQILESVSGLLGWDELVNLPPESSDHREEQSAAIAEICHEASVDPEIGRILSRLESESESIDPDAQIVVREARKDYDRNAKLPAEYVQRKARLDSAAYHAWARAKEKSDFAGFSDYLLQQLDCAKEFAGYLGGSERPYDCMIRAWIVSLYPFSLLR